MSLGHRSKARKTPYNGRMYDSMLEASVARDLDLLLKTRKVKAVQPQVRFDLYGKNGNKVCSHIVDFLVTLNNDTQKVIEPKGEETGEWKLKRKLFLDNYPHIEYITVKREDINYGKLIDIPRNTGPLPPNSYGEDVKSVMRYFK